jgi:hypothetical protein
MDLLPIDYIELSHYLGKISINNNDMYDIEIGVGCFDYGNDEIHNERKNFYQFMIENAEKISDITSELYSLEKGTNLLNDFIIDYGIIQLNVSSRFARFIYSRAFRMTHKVAFKCSKDKEKFAHRYLFPHHVNTLIIRYNIKIEHDIIDKILTILDSSPNIIVLVFQVKHISNDMISRLRTKVVAVSQRSKDFKIINKLGEQYAQLLEQYPPNINDDSNWGRIARCLDI